jgi:hypothetical protein
VIARLIPAFFLPLAIAVLAPDRAQGQFTGKQGDGVISIVRTNYHGWPDSIVLGNQLVEVVIVPAIGRVMQFRWKGDQDGPFWENPAFEGKSPDPKSSEWGNFGGDKTWPAPQADWPMVTPRTWPPPPAFDSMPVEAKIDHGQVILTSPIDPYYGIRTRRVITMDGWRPLMSIQTTFEKVAGEPSRVAVWTITQLKDPVAVYAPVPSPSIFPKGYTVTSKEAPPGLKVEAGLLSVTRDPKTAHKVGNDSGTLVWVGGKWMVRIDSARVPGGEYTHSGNSAEIFTNTDAVPYVELELLGPLATMKVGDQIERSNRYTLFQRSGGDDGAEVRKMLRAIEVQ